MAAEMAQLTLNCCIRYILFAAQIKRKDKKRLIFFCAENEMKATNPACQ